MIQGNGLAGGSPADERRCQLTLTEHPEKLVRVTIGIEAEGDQAPFP